MSARGRKRIRRHRQEREKKMREMGGRRRELEGEKVE